MVMIVAHHFVVNSGLTSHGSMMMENQLAPNSLYLWIIGAWGKTGINCFMMITGYFMCKSSITIHKFLKLLLQVYFYRITIFLILLETGYETLSLQRLVRLAIPVWGFTDNFVSCFLVFYLTIPFWTILVRNMNRNQHSLLLLIVGSCYTILGSVPYFDVSFNYITWFGFIFLIASYIRLYPSPIYECKVLWRWLTFVFVLLGITSILTLLYIHKGHYFFLSDSNKIIAVTVAVCSFLWFKNMNIKYNKVINTFGASTFGVLLIHANSDAMRQWLWYDFIDCVGHFSLPLGSLLLYSFGTIIGIFLVCNLIDQLRITTIEKTFFYWFDNRFATSADRFVMWLTKS